MKQCFRLYTWQLPDWDIRKEKRDPSKGSRGWGDDMWESLQSLYTKLEEKIGTLDVLWCYGEYDHWRQYTIRRLWVLDAPSTEIFQFLDVDIWEAMVDDVRNNKQVGNGRWDQLIVERDEGIERLSAGNSDNVTSLVHVPLLSSIRVDDCSKFNKGPSFYNASYEDLPVSECEAMKCRGN